MRNSINGTHLVRSDNAVVSILRRKDDEHCFLVIEWLDENEHLVSMRADLGYKMLADGSHDKKKAQIYYGTASHDWLVSQSEAKNFYFETFELTLDQKISLIKKIQDDQNRDLDYIRWGNQNSLMGGAVGGSLDTLGSSEAKQASIESNHAYIKRNNLFTRTIHDTLDANLHRGYSCLSWAIEVIQLVQPDYNPSILGTLFVSVPQLVLADKNKETSNRVCRLI